MFRSLTDHHQGDTIFVLTSVTKIIDVAACLQVIIGNEFSRNLINWCLCIFYHIWSSGCLFSLPVVMCVLGPVLSCYCYAIPGMTDSILLFFSCAIATNTIFKQLTIKTDRPNNPNGIYSIECITCNKKYVGQSGRDIQIRYKEHINQIKNCNPQTI